MSIRYAHNASGERVTPSFSGERAICPTLVPVSCFVAVVCVTIGLYLHFYSPPNLNISPLPIFLSLKGHALVDADQSTLELLTGYVPSPHFLNIYEDLAIKLLKDRQQAGVIKQDEAACV